MKVTVRKITPNIEVLNRARITVWKNGLETEPTTEFMDSIYRNEHSPCRDAWFVVEIRGVKSFVATHLARHSIGYTPYISTQRDDRLVQDVPRDDLPQGALVNMDITLNAQSFINVSRRRSCFQSHVETVLVWDKVLAELAKVDYELHNKCVPNCIYRCGCPENTNNCKFFEKFVREFPDSMDIFDIQSRYDFYEERYGGK